ncbi:geranylgeranyl pyrophosphate synthase [Actinoallomurus iriomotensis]|uniref:Geranylgeranyl pyrophosphate synthase n=1 Tax=Actinoallomurus iriomotensis TaxID=478107 RepID=A0A9W6RDE8_9ACTN|nr:geranylgeranyl pyrophosphate synthase [Actinoallomurus iriomotensis]
MVRRRAVVMSHRVTGPCLRATSLDHVAAHEIRKRVDEALYAFVDDRRPLLGAVSADLTPLLTALDALLSGGKRLRPAFCYWGWRGSGGADLPEFFTAAASLELLQAGALIHDDVMDGSDTRRGMPAVHRRFEALHAESGWRGSAEGFGAGAAILLGNVCLTWCDEMYQGSGLPDDALTRGRPLFNQMRTEVMCGQYLDLLGQARGRQPDAHEMVETALRVVRFKSAKYTVERPLQLGAALAGSPSVAALSAYGMPVGIAFQLRDDVLGVYGDPAETGKPAGDDLREGKRTVLVALTLERASAAEATTVERLLGDPELDAAGVETLREIIVTTGALDACEEMIDRYASEASAALAAAPLTADARAALSELTVAATARTV